MQKSGHGGGRSYVMKVIPSTNPREDRVPISFLDRYPEVVEGKLE